jgi:hypothetical protein
MLTDVLALTLLQLAVGLSVCNLFTPSKDLSGGFFAMHGLIAGICLGLAWLASGAGGNRGILLRNGIGRGQAPELSGWLLGIALAALVVHTLAARAGRLSLSKKSLAASVLAGIALLATRVRAEPFVSHRGIGPVWLAVGLVLGALLFGAVVWAMNLGHWYLVSKTLPFQLLVRATEVLAVLVLVRGVFALVALGLVARTSAGPAGAEMADLLDPARDGFFFWSRVLWGLVAPLVLAPYVVKTARMKSNKAATGLLYVGLVFVMIGELLASYLTLRSGLPA